MVYSISGTIEKTYAICKISIPDESEMCKKVTVLPAQLNPLRAS